MCLKLDVNLAKTLELGHFKHVLRLGDGEVMHDIQTAAARCTGLPDWLLRCVDPCDWWLSGKSWGGRCAVRAECGSAMDCVLSDSGASCGCQSGHVPREDGSCGEF